MAKSTADNQKPKQPEWTLDRSDDGCLVVRIPVQFRRRNGRHRVLAGEEAIEPSLERNDSLVANLAKAHHWQHLVESGRVGSIEELAEANGVDRTYIGRMLRLTSLAPDLVTAILAGRDPDGMSLRKLHRGVPELWDEQRAQWTVGA